MRVHILQHVPFEDIGSMACWLDKSGASVTYTHFFEKATLPQIASLDLIIIMGGPMSVNDELTFPWFREEKRFICDAIKSGVAVLGVCLGAQLIVSALGARVYRNPEKEIGWFPVERTSDVENVFNFPKTCMAFHWHGETFDLPEGAIRLAKSVACENQVFQLGRNVIGLQFHLEVTPETVGDLLDNCSTELIHGPYIQTESDLRRADSATYAKINSIMDDVLAYVTRKKIL